MINVQSLSKCTNNNILFISRLRTFSVVLLLVVLLMPQPSLLLPPPPPSGIVCVGLDGSPSSGSVGSSNINIPADGGAFNLQRQITRWARPRRSLDVLASSSSPRLLSSSETRRTRCRVTSFTLSTHCPSFHFPTVSGSVSNYIFESMSFVS